MTNLLIIGGSDAGISAALRAREVDPGAEVTVVVSDSFPNYSICGLPFYLSGEVPDWHWLAHRTAEEITGVGVHLLLDHTAQVIDPVDHVVTVVAHGRQADWLRYDRLVIATGAVPVRPPIVGLDLPGVYLLRSMEDSFAVHARLEAQAPPSAVINRKTGRLLGAQMLGHWYGEVAKRIDVFATALFHGMLVDDLNALDLSYTPPVSSPWDPVQMSAQAWVKQNR